MLLRRARVAVLVKTTQLTTIYINTCFLIDSYRCDAMNFRLSKSNKKLLKRFNAFLRNGAKSEHGTSDHGMNSADGDAAMESNGSCNISENMLAMANCRRSTKTVDMSAIQMMEKTGDGVTEAAQSANLVNSDMVAEQSNGDKVSTNGSTVMAEVKRNNDTSGADPNKPMRKKAKLLRIERKKEKQLMAGATSGLPPPVDKHAERMNRNQEATLRSLINATAPDSVHQLQVNQQ